MPFAYHTTCNYRLAVQDFASRIPLEVFSQLAQDAASAVNARKFEAARQLISSSWIDGPEQSVALEGLMTGVSLANPRVVDAAKVTGCLRYFDLWITEKTAVEFPDVILTRSTWGATEWTPEDRRSYFVDDLGVYFRTKLGRAGFKPVEIFKTAEHLGNFAEAGSENWPLDWPVDREVVEAANSYEISRRKGATNAEIGAMAGAIRSSLQEEALSKLENTTVSEIQERARRQSEEIWELLRWPVLEPPAPKPAHAAAKSLFKALVEAGYEPKSIIALAAELAVEAGKH